MSELEAGRELDVLVAEKVMGLVHGVDFGDWPEHQWKLDEDGEVDIFGYDGDTHNGPACTRCGYGYCHHCEEESSEPCEIAPRPYSTNLLAAWQVVEKLIGRVVIDHWSSDGYHVSIYLPSNPPSVDAHADTAPLAICRAALAAVADQTTPSR